MSARPSAVLPLLLLLTVAGCAKQVLSPDLPSRRARPSSRRSRNATAARLATRYLGAPYVWAGSSPSGFDCSGLVMYAFSQVGVAIPHNAAQQFRLGVPVDRDRLIPGDIVFFNQLRHNGIYLGDGRFVHSTKPGGVKIARLDGRLVPHALGGGAPALGFVLLDDLDLHLTVVVPLERDEIRPAADRAVLGERLVPPAAVIGEHVVLFPAERAVVGHGRHSKPASGYSPARRREP